MQGLSDAEAQRRLAAAGEPPPPPTSRSYKSILVRNAFTLFNLILAVFFVVILAAGRPADALFGGVLVANTAIGVLQEVRAKRTLDRAALLVAPRARVVRDGRERQEPVDHVVDGDLIALRPGDQVVADGVVVQSTGLLLDESPLTGESLPVSRGVGDPVLSGSFSVEGSGSYLAERTGTESYAARLLAEARTHRRPRSPLEQQINRLLKVLVSVMVPLAGALIFVLVRRNLPFRESAATATAGIVTLVPEGLILLTSLTFAVAAVRLARRGMLVQYLNAVESLAGVDTVCLDKTGTLTDGSLLLHEVVPLGGAQDAERLLGEFAASSSAPNDTLTAIAQGLPTQAQSAELEVPFSSRWKWSAIRLHGSGQTLVLGAPDVLLPGAVPAAAGEHERAGRRVLLFGRAVGPVAEPEPETPPPPPRVEPLALVVLQERLRGDASATVEFLRRQGVAVKVMSGDSPATVAAIAEQVGIEPGGRVWEGSQLPEGSGADLTAAARDGTVFARLTPHQKRALVDALAGLGAYVAMIGDGVNDVPAMKAARLAIALGSGSQLAKSVADSVLISDRFGAIPDAVGEGRKIIRNVQRVAKLFVTKSVFAAFVIATFGLTTGSFPLLPRHLSLAATFTVGIPGFVLALAPGTAAPEGGSFLRRVARFSIPAGCVMGAGVLLSYLVVSHTKDHTVTDGRTAAVTVFVAIGLYVLLLLEADRMQVSRRYAIVVLALVGFLAGGYLAVLGSDVGRSFFALSRPGLLEAAVVTLTLVGSIRLLSWMGLSPYRAAA